MDAINTSALTIIYFVYGLAFFCMGLAIILEGGRGSDVRLRLALRPLAAFGIIHGLHEWMDMYQNVYPLSKNIDLFAWWSGLKLSLLTFSFLSLAGFGFSALAPNLRVRRITLLAPLIMASIWGFGVFSLRIQFPAVIDIWRTSDVWTRYSLGIPSALAAAFGLIAQQRAFRQAGMAQFGRDSLTAAIAFGWYGLVGQLFVHPSRLTPSTYIHQELFYSWFGVPIQLLRAFLAVIITIAVIRLMRSFDTEIKREIAHLQNIQLEESRQREELRGKLLQRIVTAQEAERRRVARELHDETGQALTAIGMGLRGLGDSLLQNPSRSQQILKKLEGLTENSLVELQRLISNLRPTHLDDLGLPAAIRWYLNEVQGHTPELSISFSLAGKSSRLPQPIKIAIFRIVQEAVTNILKHAKATQVTVTLAFTPETVRISVQDNGIGMNLEQMEHGLRPTWGLLGMRERATLLGGEFDIQSKLGEGLCVSICIPINPDHIEKVENIYEKDPHPVS